MKIQKVSRCGLAVSLLSLFAAAHVGAQTPYVLFQDGFENTAPGTQPASNAPTAGSYIITGNTNQIQVFTGGNSGGPSGITGPSGAAVGNNYLRYDESDYSTNVPAAFVQALFTTPFLPTNQPFHVQFYLWAPGAGGAPVFSDNWPEAALGNATALSSNNTFLHSADVHTSAWEWYNGAYHASGLTFSTNNWDFVQMDWNGSSMTGTINGNSTSLGTWGSAANVMDRLMFHHAVTNTLFYIDDVKVTTTVPILVRSLSPLPGAVALTRQPLIQIQLANAVQSLNASAVQLYFNSVQVTPTVTQTNSGGDTYATVTYPLSADLAYGSTNTVECVYADGESPAVIYSNVWTFTVYSGDKIFSDNFEAAHLQNVPFHYSSYDGSNCLVLDRLSATGPSLNGFATTNATSSTNDVIDFKFAVRIGVASMGLYLGSTTNLTVQLNLFANGNVALLNTTGASQFLPTLMNTNNTVWNTLEIITTNASGIFSVSVNGAPFQTLPGGIAKATGIAGGIVSSFRIATTGAAATTWSDDIVMSNMTTQVLMFQDGFEQDPDYISPATNSPIVGTYSYLSASAGLIQAQPGVIGTNALPSPPNAPQIGTYVTNLTTALVTTGTGHSGTNYVSLVNGLEIVPTFTTPIPTGSVLHAECFINWTAGNVAWGFDAPGTNEFARVTLNSSYGVTLFDGANEVDTGLGHSVGVWEYYELDYVVGSSSITVTVDGTPSVIPITPQSTINGLFFFADPASSGSANVDDVFATADLGNLPATNPLLKESSGASLVNLSWTNATGYVLQQNTSLANTNGWVNVTGGGVSPVQVGTGTTTFFRLSKPN